MTRSSLNFSAFALILTASLPFGCGKQEFAGHPQPSDETVAGEGSLRLANATFPEEAELLTLTIHSGLPNIPEGPTYLPCSDSPIDELRDGMGLTPPAKSRKKKPSQKDCLTPPFIEHDSITMRIVDVKNGEEIKPIRLPVGSYVADAVFFDASDQPIYTGGSGFEINDGEQTTVKIILKKIASGDVSIDFEVEEPTFLPTSISDDAQLKLFRWGAVGKDGSILREQIFIDLLVGVTGTNSECIGGEKCPKMSKEKITNLSETQLEKIRSILRSVVLKKAESRFCTTEYRESITMSLEKCNECISKKPLEFYSNDCGGPHHSLTIEQFQQILTIIQSKPTRK